MWVSDERTLAASMMSWILRAVPTYASARWSRVLLRRSVWLLKCFMSAGVCGGGVCGAAVREGGVAGGRCCAERFLRSEPRVVVVVAARGCEEL